MCARISVEKNQAPARLEHRLVDQAAGYSCEVCQWWWKTRPVSGCPGVKRYTWDNRPEYLQTKVWLELHGKTVQGLAPAGVVESQRDHTWTFLYDEREARRRVPARRKG